jgi:flavin reductase (DIM6/NTAB) family NADH-FMN oxidoreductase RutF
MPDSKVALGPRPLVYPMPAFLVGANVNGKPNYMTVAWGGIACSNPPMLTIALQHHRHTYQGINLNGTFSVNIPSVSKVTETDYCGIVSGTKTDKAAACRFKTFYGKLENAPMIQQCPVNLECKLLHNLNLGSHALLVGEIMEVYIDPDCLTEGKPDVDKIKPFLYSDGTGAQYRAFGSGIGSAFKDGKQLKATESGK